MPRILRLIKPIPEIFKAIANYDKATGVITNRQGKVIGGKPAGGKYGQVNITKHGRYLSHRVAWFLYYGEQPPNIIDHINGDPTDNRIENLRAATVAENLRNQATRKDNTSGFKGVCACPSGNGWTASIRAGKVIHIGTYATKDEAAIAYAAASKVLHKEFGRLK